MNINKIAKEIHNNAKEKGFYKDSLDLINFLKDNNAPQSMIELVKNLFICQKLLLIQSEVSEAMEALRNSDLVIDNEMWVKHSFQDELVDTTIRIFDLAESLGIDLEKSIDWKHKYNITRENKHGKNF